MNVPLDSQQLHAVLNIDTEVQLSELTGDLLQWLSTLEPFGVANPQPTFLTCGVNVLDTRYMGREGQHLRLRLKQGNHEWTALAFNKATHWIEGTPHIDLVYTIATDYWNGEKRVNLKILDFRPAEG